MLVYVVIGVPAGGCLATARARLAVSRAGAPRSGRHPGGRRPRPRHRAVGAGAGEVNIDTWLALVTGREVWQSGIPHQVTLTTIALGQPWIDQQWLSELVSYAAYRIGGLGLLSVLGAAALTGGVAGAMAGARRLGATMLSVLLIAPLALVLVLPSREIRTQDFAIPLFVAVIYLIVTDLRRPSRRVLWCLPLLILWANLHGSVILGAMLVGLHGVTLAWERRRSLAGPLRAWARPLALVAGATGAVLITPYGLGIAGYYRSTLLGGSLRHAVTEWRPITSAPVEAAALGAILAIAVSIWALGRRPLRIPLWERLSLLALALAAASVQRNALFFGLFALLAVPAWLGLGSPAGADPADRRRGLVNSAPPADRRRTRVNGALVGLALVAAVAGAMATLSRSPASIELHSQRPGVLAAVQRAVRANPSLRIFGEVHFDDWLLWRDPGLRRRIAFDASFELLTPGQLHQVQNLFSGRGRAWKRAARGYRLLVLDRTDEPVTVHGFEAEPGHRVLYDDGARLVILRSAGQAAQD